MFSIKATVGPDEYSSAAHSGWTKIYSTILDHIVPEVVKYELAHPDDAQAVLDKRMGRMSTVGSVTSLATNNLLCGNGLSYHANDSARCPSMHHEPSTGGVTAYMSVVP